MNSTFRIAFGCYELVLDRKSLTYSLTETTTQTSWADGLSVGWIELTERETGQQIRHEFGDCKIISVSEKMSGTGKRLLLGLDTPEGMPIDVYFTCAEKEIQLTVEASRDTKTHTLHRIGLLPGLCRGVDRYVLPIDEGALISPKDVLIEPQALPLWQSNGLSMAFFGGLKSGSALALLTDSAYAMAVFSQTSCDWVYERDPERRRLEIRLVLIPHGDHISIARAYRDKLVSERAHVTLRKKLRERPYLQDIISKPYKFTAELDLLLENSYKSAFSKWDAMESISEQFKAMDGIRHVRHRGDWLSPFTDSWFFLPISFRYQEIPLNSVVHRDSVIPVKSLFPEPESVSFKIRFLKALLCLSRPKNSEYASFADGYQNWQKECVEKEHVLMELYSATFAAFLNTHRFLSDDLQVQEAIYTDKTRVVVNFSKSEGYACEEFELPPLGFIASHSQIKVYDALRVGEEQFSTRELRIVRSGTA
ncbi:MAG: hypothetical protein QM758_22575 [Armatimonas sp.]